MDNHVYFYIPNTLANGSPIIYENFSLLTLYARRSQAVNASTSHLNKYAPRELWIITYMFAFQTLLEYGLGGKYLLTAKCGLYTGIWP